MNRKSTSPADSDSKGAAKKTYPQGEKVTSTSSRESSQKNQPSEQETKRRIGQLA